jgi:hypothetical protein
VMTNNNIPRVTAVIAAMFPERWKPDPWYMERGTFIHKACELHDTGELDRETVDPVIFPYCTAYWRFLDETKFKPEVIEQRYTHRSYKYTGRIDRAGHLNGNFSLIDIKSGVESETDKLQAGAYWGLIEDVGVRVKNCFDLYLREDGSYRLKEVADHRKMFNVFLAALTVWRWKEGL